MPMSYSTRERRKRAKIKADKAAIDNQLAAAAAHIAQVNRHVETVQANAAAMDANGKRLAAALEDAQSLAASRAASIDAFKQETLALTIQAAEMRGYIARTLEDDAVREATMAPVPQQDCVVETRFMPRAVNDHHRVGPDAMGKGTPWDHFQWNGREVEACHDRQYQAFANDPLGQRPPKHWTQR